MKALWMVLLCATTIGNSDAPQVAYTIRAMEVTGYCICEKCCGIYSDGITASGVAASGFYVAAPPRYPYGTVMVIAGYAGGRTVTVQDRGGAIINNRLDILFPSHQAALVWGRRIVNVIVFER